MMMKINLLIKENIFNIRCIWLDCILSHGHLRKGSVYTCGKIKYISSYLYLLGYLLLQYVEEIVFFDTGLMEVHVLFNRDYWMSICKKLPGSVSWYKKGHKQEFYLFTSICLFTIEGFSSGMHNLNNILIFWNI